MGFRGLSLFAVAVERFPGSRMLLASLIPQPDFKPTKPYATITCLLKDPWNYVNVSHASFGTSADKAP